jgi:hypothetical protein
LACGFVAAPETTHFDKLRRAFGIFNDLLARLCRPAAGSAEPDRLETAFFYHAVPGAAVAITTTISFVLMQLSIVTALKESSTAQARASFKADFSMRASVKQKASMVAIFMRGAIMPAPLETPHTVTALPPITTRKDAVLANVSVVITALAADGNPLTLKDAHKPGIAALILSIASGLPMIPVTPPKPLLS